jgi:phytoene dehydrogenase-like protein
MDDLQVNQFDTIVVGAGHNGLICAAYLARSGQRVLVLEAADTLGGLAATREFHPGFKASIAHSVNQFSTKIASDLNLEAHGFKLGKALATVALNDAGEHVILQQGTLSGVSPDDAKAYAAYCQTMKRFASFLKPVWLTSMPRIGNNSLSEIMTFARIGLKLRLLGKDDMGEFMRLAALPVRDLMEENFDSDLVKAALSWDGLIGSKMAPRSPNHTVLAMLYRMSGEYGGDHALPAGGIEGLIGALSSAAKDAGAEIRTGAEVAQILIGADQDGLTTTGVELADSEQIGADRVVSSADPQRTLLELVGTQNLEIEFSNRIRRLRCDGYVAKLHLALNDLPEFSGLDRADGRLIIAPDLDAIEFAFDDAKYGENSERPLMEIVIPSLHDASFAPAGRHVLSAHIMYVPYHLKGGWTDEAREALCERVIGTIARYAPGIRDQIIHQELLTPLDLERTCNVTGGHWHHTEFALDQMLMMRPTYEAAQYSTPIPGLYLCGAGCHPGGGLMGGPGHNAAHEILK